MGWFRSLFVGSGSTITPRYGAAKEDPEPMDWPSVESRLVDLVTRHLQVFAETHQSESFYAFGLDCNSDEGQVLLCLNSREGQLAAARKSLKKHPEFYPSQSEDDVAKSIEWGFGDWKYQGFNVRSKTWRVEWRAVESRVASDLGMLGINRKLKAMEDLRESFLEMATRALLRIEASDAIRAIRRDPDFRTLCADHDEGPEEGFSRMQRLAGRAT